MALDLAALRTEFYARGFDSLNDGGAGVTRATRWLNDAMHEIDDMDRWPYRYATASGVGPLTVSDLGEIETVYDATRSTVLDPDTQGTLLNTWGDLTSTGNSSTFYMLGNQVSGYPVSTSSLTVNYWRVSPDMSATTDTPLMPDRYRMAIVHLAVANGLIDKSNYQEAAGARLEADRIVQRMRETYVLQTGGSRVAAYGFSGDW